MHRVEVVPHTADVALRVTAESRAELFTGAAEAMFGLMHSCAPGGETIERRISVDGADTVELLWDWLSTLLSWSEVDGASYRRFDLELDLEPHGGSAAGTAHGVPIDGCEVAGPPIKAVTLHGLTVEDENGRWVATIVFDV